MVAGIPDIAIVVGFFGLIYIIGTRNSNGTHHSTKTGEYNRGSLQRASHDKLKRYVATVWEHKGYTTEISLNDAEYIDVHAESDQEIVAISVRPRKEENRVSKNAVKRFMDSSRGIEADQLVMATSSYFTAPAKGAAEEANIRLLNGEDLAALFTKQDGIPS